MNYLEALHNRNERLWEKEMEKPEPEIFICDHCANYATHYQEKISFDDYEYTLYFCEDCLKEMYNLEQQKDYDETLSFEEYLELEKIKKL